MKIGTGEVDFVFSRRSRLVPGDMRIAWRVPVTLLILHHSRGQRASLAKLHLMNDALRSPDSQMRLAEIVNGGFSRTYWRMRVEPALGRCLDFMAGEGQVARTIVSDKMGLLLTDRGKLASKAIMDLPSDILEREREFLAKHSKSITETFVNGLLATGKRLV